MRRWWCSEAVTAAALRHGDPRPRFAAIARLLKAGGQKDAIGSFFISAAYAAKGDKDRALAALEKTFMQGYRDFAAINASPYFASLRSDPRFQQLVKQYQQ